MRARLYLTWARSLPAPRTRFLPGLGARLGAHPRLAAAILVALRSLPGRRLRRAAYVNVSRPLVDRMTAHLQVPVSGGLRIIADTSDFVGSTLAAAGMWEPHLTRPFQRLLSPGDVFVDVGAHIGYYTLLASKLVGPEGHVYALEPTRTTYEALCANLALNDVANVTALCVAAGAEEGRALLGDAPPGHSARASVRGQSGTDRAAEHGDAATTSVDVRPVASVVPQSERERVRLVKIDVEGYEAEVLLGLEALFEMGTRPALLVEIHADAVNEVAAYLVKLATAYGLTALELVEEEPFERAAPAGPPREVSSLLASGLRDRPTMNLLVTAGDSVRDSPGRPTGASVALSRHGGRRRAHAVKLVMTLLCRDEADIVDAHIAFHLNAGVDFVIVTDHRSQDGTTEILESYVRDGHVRLLREDGERIRQAEWVTRMARLAATEHEADWVLLSDADEFWWPRGGSLKDVLAAVPERYGVVHAVSRPFVPVLDDGRFFAERMTVRLTTRAPINDTATPFRPVAKAAHRGDPRVVVGQGSHEVSGIDRPPFRWSPIELLHFPLRSPEQCARKYEKTWLAWEKNLRGDIARARTLPQSDRSSFWDGVVLDDVARESGLAAGSIVSDTRLRDALRILAGVAELPANGTAGFRPQGDPPRLVFPHPTLADETAYAVDCAVLREATVVRARRKLDELERRIDSLERRASRSMR